MLACQLLVEFQIVFTGHLNTCTVTNNIKPQSLPPLMPVWMDEDSYSDNITHDLYVENLKFSKNNHLCSARIPSQNSFHTLLWHM